MDTTTRMWEVERTRRQSREVGSYLRDWHETMCSICSPERCSIAGKFFAHPAHNWATCIVRMALIDIFDMNRMTITSPEAYEARAYRAYVLGMLVLVYGFNFIDRQLLAILQEAVKADLGLSDTQLGLLTGFAFSLFYVSAGIPIARLADHGNRRDIVALSIGVWSFMTVISGLCNNFFQLLLARIGVGIGEAGGTPPSHSMISDIFAPKDRAKALSIYSIGISIGVMFGFLLGGILNEVFGWRVAFFVVGAPGILIAIWVRLTVAEPKRGWSESLSVETERLALTTVIRMLISNSAVRHIVVASAFSSMAGYGLMNWTPSFFIRIHNMQTGELGVWLAMAVGISGGIGGLLAGYLTDRFGMQNRAFYAWLPGGALILTTPLAVAVLMTSDKMTALNIFLAQNLLMVFWLGPSLAVLHGLVDQRMRAITSALYLFVVNLVGLGLGPLLIGILSDTMTPELGKEAIRYAMLYVGPTAFVLASIHFYLAGRHLRQ